MLKRHCNVCDGVAPKPYAGERQRWISIFPEPVDDMPIPRRVSGETGVAEVLTGDYCSVGCLQQALAGLR